MLSITTVILILLIIREKKTIIFPYYILIILYTVTQIIYTPCNKVDFVVVEIEISVPLITVAIKIGGGVPMFSN